MKSSSSFVVRRSSFVVRRSLSSSSLTNVGVGGLVTHLLVLALVLVGGWWLVVGGWCSRVRHPCMLYSLTWLVCSVCWFAVCTSALCDSFVVWAWQLSWFGLVWRQRAWSNIQWVWKSFICGWFNHVHCRIGVCELEGTVWCVCGDIRHDGGVSGSCWLWWRRVWWRHFVSFSNERFRQKTSSVIVLPMSRVCHS